MIRQRWVSGTYTRGFFDSRPVRDAIGIVFFLLFLALLVVGVARCKPVEDPSGQAADVVGALARGVRAGDRLCAQLARDRKDEQLAKACAFAYDAARVSLDTADTMIDDGKLGDLPCVVAQALAYTRQMAALLEVRGVTLPPLLSRALGIAPAVTEACNG